MNVGAAVTDDGRYLIIYQTKGSSPKNELAVQGSLSSLTRQSCTSPRRRRLYSPIDNDGTRFWITDHSERRPTDASSRSILRNPRRENWKTDHSREQRTISTA